MLDTVAWPEDLILVFAAIGKAMGGGRLNPEVLKLVPSEIGMVVPDYEVRLEHLPKSVTARYLIRLSGDRWAGAQWSFRSGDLERLSLSAAKGNRDG